MQTITESGTLSNGQNVSTTSTVPDFTVDGEIEFSHTVDIGATDNSDINIGLIIDTSGSTSGSSGSDVDGDGTTDTFLEAQVIAAKALFQNYIDLGYDPDRINITLVEYNSSGTPLGTFDLNDQAAFEDALDDLSPGGLTNFSDPLSDLHDVWTGQGVDDTSSNTVVFMSDGLQNRGGNFDDEAQDLIDDFGANISGIGVGSNASLTAGSNGGLNDLDNTGGGAIVTDAAALIEEINSPPPNVDVDSVTITFTYDDPNTPGATLTYTETYVVGAANSPLLPTPTGYAINAQMIDLEPDPIDGTDVNVQITTTFDNGQSTISTSSIIVPAVPCFSFDTKIVTNMGEISAGTLNPNNQILTLDHGFQPIRWIGLRKVTASMMQTNPKLRPVRIRAGSLGPAQPSRDMLVSRQHRVLVKSQVAQRMFDTSEVLVAAIRLVGLPGIEIAEDIQHVTYVHFLLDQHEIVVSDGAYTESLYIGALAQAVLPKPVIEEISTLFPELLVSERAQHAARPLPHGKMQKRLIERLKKNNKSVFAPDPDRASAHHSLETIH